MTLVDLIAAPVDFSLALHSVNMIGIGSLSDIRNYLIVDIV